MGRGIASLRLYHDSFRFYIAHEEVPPHLVATDMIVRIPQGPWPSVALAPPGRYDALKFIDNEATGESSMSCSGQAGSFWRPGTNLGMWFPKRPV